MGWTPGKTGSCRYTKINEIQQGKDTLGDHGNDGYSEAGTGHYPNPGSET